MYVNIHATICPVGIVTVNKVGTFFSERTTRFVSTIQNEEKSPKGPSVKLQRLPLWIK